jgi:hypothetical protein
LRDGRAPDQEGRDISRQAQPRNGSKKDPAMAEKEENPGKVPMKQREYVIHF